MERPQFFEESERLTLHLFRDITSDGCIATFKNELSASLAEFLAS